MVAQSQRYSCENCSDDKDIVSCELTKEIFVNSSDPSLIKMVEEKNEALDRLEQVGITGILQ